VVGDDGRSWSTAATCSPARPRERPQPISLAAEPAAFAQGLVRSVQGRGADAQAAPSLIVGSGSRPEAQTVVYVHGVGNKPRASVLKCQWDTALFGSEMGDRTRMAYWVDRDRYPRIVEATCGQPDRTATDDDEATTATILGLSSAAAPQSGPAREDEALAREIAAMASDGGHRAALTDIAARLVAAGEADLPPGALEDFVRQARRPGATSARVFPLPEPIRRVLARLLTRVFLRDVNDFLFDEKKRKAMTDALWDRLRGGGEPFVVVAHSQGSMIAYDLLRRLRAGECDVRLLVTIGSPLGLREVKDHFVRQGGPLAAPECVARWVNVAERLDPVAVDPSLAGEYGRNSRGVAVEDHAAWGLNPDSPRSPHSATGYLGTAEVRDAVRSVVGNAFSQFVAGSVVARDVAASAEDAEARALHDVLIQLADPEDGGPPRPLDRIAADLVKGLTELAAGRPKDLPFEAPDVLRRFVQARLTRAEIDGLRTLSARLRVKQVWANSRKRALINVSTSTVQAATANLGYRATGSGITWAVVDLRHRLEPPAFLGPCQRQAPVGLPRPRRPEAARPEAGPQPRRERPRHACRGHPCGTVENVLVDGVPTTMSGWRRRRRSTASASSMRGARGTTPASSRRWT
jgi:hypothetical protein